MGSEPNPPVYLLPLPLEPRVVQRPLLVTCLAPLLLGLGAWGPYPAVSQRLSVPYFTSHLSLLKCPVPGDAMSFLLPSAFLSKGRRISFGSSWGVDYEILPSHPGCHGDA